MKKTLIFALLALVPLSAASAIPNVDASASATVSNAVSQQNSFTVISYYYNGNNLYKAKLRLKLVRSIYGINDYIATEYAVNQFNGQWQWHTCSASCHYDQIKKTYGVMIGGTTFYFDAPLD